MAKKTSSGNPLEQPFVNAILANPEEDAPRLVYADWLDENGQPARAELIRVQVRLARMPDNDPDRPALAAREKQILNEHQEEWTAPVRKAGTTVAWFRRGLIESAQLFVTAAGLAALANSPHLTRLRELEIWRNPVGDEGVRALAGSPLLGRLRQLNLTETELTDDAVLALTAVNRLCNVEEVLLGWNEIGDEAALALANHGVRALIHSPHLSGLRELGLVNLGIDPETEGPDSAFVELLASAAASGTGPRTAVTWGGSGNDLCPHRGREFLRLRDVAGWSVSDASQKRQGQRRFCEASLTENGRPVDRSAGRRNEANAAQVWPADPFFLK